MQNRFLARSLQAMFMAFMVSGLAHADAAEDAQAAFTKFFSAFVSRNQAQVAALFAPDAQFYGTVSPALVTTPEGVLSYFTAALDRPDFTEAKALNLTTTALTDSIALVAGTWKVDRTVEGKTTVGDPLRITAVLQKRSDRWMVVQFHNSRLPAPPAPPSPAVSR
jgi:uncharacterized protein (TIGR02246 family)